MEDSRQQSLHFIIFLMTLLILINLIIFNYNSNNTKKEIKVDTVINDTSSSINNEKAIKNSEVLEENERDLETQQMIPTEFYSSDKKYYLNLDNTNNTYEMSIDNYLSKDYFSGHYTIENHQLTLNIEKGCLDTNNNFTCILPENVTFENNTYKQLILYYDTTYIKLGKVKIYAK